MKAWSGGCDSIWWCDHGETGAWSEHNGRCRYCGSSQNERLAYDGPFVWWLFPGNDVVRAQKRIMAGLLLGAVRDVLGVDPIEARIRERLAGGCL